MSAPGGIGARAGLGGASLVGALAWELAEIERLHAPAPVELPAELVRLGAELPHPPAAAAEAAIAVPNLALLREVERIGAHLGRIERACDGLGPAEARHAAELLARVRVLVDCASALADLRQGVLSAMRTARPA